MMAAAALCRRSIVRRGLLTRAQQGNVTEIEPSIVTAQSFLDKFDAACACPGDQLPRVACRLSGRIISRRESGSKLIFVTLVSNHGHVQAVLEKSRICQQQHFDDCRSACAVGNIVQIDGYPGRTKRGELSVLATFTTLLTKCTAPVNFDRRHRNPEDMESLTTSAASGSNDVSRTTEILRDPGLRARLQLRSRAVAHLRQFLTQRGFDELETPVLSANANGATARPFTTQRGDGAGAETMFLRISPELYLKKLLVAGFERVFEVGKQFRNESRDKSHLPEFLSCEIYQAYGRLADAMEMTEQLIESLYAARFTARAEPPATPFARIDIVPQLRAGLAWFPDDDAALSCVSTLKRVYAQSNTPLPPAPHSARRLLDGLIKAHIEPQCIAPTFLIGQPIAMSPLARARRDNPYIAERFELFVNGSEIANGYEELTDPVEQRRRFEQQANERHALGDEEAPLPDESYCRALENGMPPAVGIGIGVDRLVMLLAGARRIRDVVAFP